MSDIYFMGMIVCFITVWMDEMLTEDENSEHKISACFALGLKYFIISVAWPFTLGVLIHELRTKKS